MPVRVAAAWSWRLIMILAAVGLAGYLLSKITVVIFRVLIAGLLAVATGSILYGIAGALFAVLVMALANTVVRYLVTRQWTVDDEITWEPYYYPWEIKKHARQDRFTREQVMAQLERFRRARAKERQAARTKHKDKQAKGAQQDSACRTSAHR